jgi:hypothetical protein
VAFRLPFLDTPASGPARPVLELSGPALTQAFEALIAGGEEQGGVESYASGLKSKAALFEQWLGGGRAAALDLESFKLICAHIAPVRRRVGAPLERRGFAFFRAAIAELLDGAEDATTADLRIAAFCARFPADREHRWVRDLAAELLHYTYPELYPLMCRWVWDAAANTGVLREIWYGEDVDHRTLEVADDHATFLVLREELSQFLTANGVFRDLLHYVDLLCAQVYAGYVDSQGGSYLRTDFSSPEDPMQYTRRLLGLDGLDPRTGRSRFKEAPTAAADAAELSH